MAEVVVLGDPRRAARFELEDIQTVRIVEKRHALFVRRPLQVLIEASAAVDGDAPRLAAAVAIRDVERVVAGLVGEPGDLAAARRPCRGAVVRAGRLSEVADWRAFLRGHCDDLAAILQRNLSEVGGRRNVAHVIDVAHAARTRLAQIGRHCDVQRRRTRGRRIEHLQPATLLEDDLAITDIGVDDWEVLVRRQLLHAACRRIERVQIEFAVAVGIEVELAADPHRVDVVAAIRRLGNLPECVVSEAHDRDARRGAAAIGFPLRLRRRLRIGDLATVGRDVGIDAPRDRQALGERSVRVDREQVHLARGLHVALRAENHATAIVEAFHEIVGAVPGQALRAAAGDRHDVDVDVAVVIATESNGCTVGREVRLRFLTLGRRHAVGAAAVAVGDPDVAVIDERDVAPVDVRLLEQQRVLRIDGERSGAPQHEQRGRQQRARVEAEHR